MRESRSALTLAATLSRPRTPATPSAERPRRYIYPRPSGGGQAPAWRWRQSTAAQQADSATSIPSLRCESIAMTSPGVRLSLGERAFNAINIILLVVLMLVTAYPLV